MRSDLLLEIADMLDNLTPAERADFNMGNWCGTTACAIGWACLKLESIRKAGLALYHYTTIRAAESYGNRLSPDQAITSVAQYGSPYACRGKELLPPFTAVEYVLDIDGLNGLPHWNHEEIWTDAEGSNLSDFLFNHNAYVGIAVPEDVSKRIREAVAHYDPTYGQSSTTSASTTSPSES